MCMVTTIVNYYVINGKRSSGTIERDVSSTENKYVNSSMAQGSYSLL